MQSYDDVVKEVDLITDGLGMPIDKKIRKTVIALRLVRVNTTGSCEGHREWGLPFPWVSVAKYLPEKDEYGWREDNMAERGKVMPLIDEFNALQIPKYPLVLQDQGMYGAFRVQSFGRDDEADPNHLEEYQKVMDAFADFIINRYSLDS